MEFKFQNINQIIGGTQHWLFRNGLKAEADTFSTTSSSTFRDSADWSTNLSFNQFEMFQTIVSSMHLIYTLHIDTEFDWHRKNKNIEIEQKFLDFINSIKWIKIADILNFWWECYMYNIFLYMMLLFDLYGESCENLKLRHTLY